MPTRIPYLDELFSPVTGCSGKGCATREECWARGMVKRFPYLHGMKYYDHETSPGVIRIPFHEVQFHPTRLDQPLHWKKPRRGGVCFMGDWMDDQVQPHWVDQILEVIAACPQHQFFSLTKQPQNLEPKIYGHDALASCRELGGGDYLPNLWNGESCCNQDDLDRMVPYLMRIPGKKWLSLEPLMGPVDIRPFKLLTKRWGRIAEGVSWVVIGSHSNPKRHPCPVEWVESVVEQCDAARVKVYIKQLDIGGRCVRDPAQFPAHLRRREMP